MGAGPCSADSAGEFKPTRAVEWLQAQLSSSEYCKLATAWKYAKFCRSSVRCAQTSMECDR